jgi:hypothetical protein
LITTTTTKSVGVRGSGGEEGGKTRGDGTGSKEIAHEGEGEGEGEGSETGGSVNQRSTNQNGWLAGSLVGFDSDPISYTIFSSVDDVVVEIN